MKVVLKTSVENITLSYKGGVLKVSGDLSGMRKVIYDPVEMLDALRHFENIGSVTFGSPDMLRSMILGDNITMAE